MFLNVKRERARERRRKAKKERERRDRALEIESASNKNTTVRGERQNVSEVENRKSNGAINSKARQ